ncbi:hypothetical protein [Streptomyces sp. NPDC058297]|uniref:hypothetical protein n=1 Tax=Streptomyces sp. NPDC058297 TaxID=3346433 RepID=UPI0036ED597C
MTCADGVLGKRRPASAFRLGLSGVSAGDGVAVPSKYRVWPHQQAHLTQHLSWQVMEERRQERAVARVEPKLLPVQLPFENADLVAQGQDLGIFLTIAHR